MKNNRRFTETSLAKSLTRFAKKEDGVYSILMAGMGASLLAIIAFAVDGSAIILDQARLSESLEQATLAVTSENNKYRKDRFQINAPRGTQNPDQFGQNLRNQRDKEIVESYVRHYMPHIESWSPDKIDCTQNIVGYNNETIRCQVSGTIVKKALLPFRFSNTANSSHNSDFSFSGSAIAEKFKSAPPLDVMIVADFSGSMDYSIADRDARYPGVSNSKSNILKSVLHNLTTNYLFKDPNTLNRIGFTAFSFGAKHPDIQGSIPYGNTAFEQDTKRALRDFNINLQNMAENCVLPYQFKQNKREVKVDGTEHNLIKFLTEKVPDWDWWTLNQAFASSIDIKASIERIKIYDGSPRHYSVIFKIQRLFPNTSNYARCVGYNKKTSTYQPAAHYWFDRTEQGQFNSFISRIQPEGATLVNAGLLVGTNLMMDKSKHRRPTDIKGNTQRTIIVLSDGRDQLLADGDYNYRASYKQRAQEDELRALTGKFIDQGVCDVIRERVDSLQDPNYQKHPTKIAFIAFGYNPTLTNEKAWKKCVGEDNYYVAQSEQQLLESFKKAFTTEEVGHSLNP